jgi:uncharacterized membrane protein YkvA (DUF1232 family)
MEIDDRSGSQRQEASMPSSSARWGALRSIGLAFKLATRPGSPPMTERLSAVPRLVAATLSGEYTGISRGRLALLAGAAAYVVSPVDLMPEGLLSVFGLGDDAVVMTWLAAALVNETESFLLWEQGRATTVPSHVV